MLSLLRWLLHRTLHLCRPPGSVPLFSKKIALHARPPRKSSLSPGGRGWG